MNHPSILRQITNSSINTCSGQRIGENVTSNANSNGSPSTPAHIRRQREKSLRDRLNDESAKNDDLYVHLSELNKEIIEKNKQINQLNEKMSELRDELSNSVDKSVHDEVVSKNEELSFKLESSKEREEMFRSLKDEIEKENSEMRDQLEKLSKQMGEIELLRNELRVSNEERDILVDETKDIISKLKARENESQEQLKSIIQNYEEQIAFLNEKIESMKPADISYVITSNDSNFESSLCGQPESLGFFHEMKANDLSRENDCLQMRIDDLTRELEQSKNQWDEEKCKYEDQVSRLTKEKSDMQSELISLQESVEQLKVSLSTEKNTLQLCLTERNALIENEQIFKSQIEGFHREIEVFNGTIDHLKQKVQSLNGELDSQKSLIECHANENDNLKKEVDRLSELISSLNKEIVEKKSEIEMHLAHISELSKVINGASCERRGLEAQVESMKDEIDSLRAQVDTQTEQIDLLNSQLEVKDNAWKECIDRLTEGLKENSLPKDELGEKDAKIRELVSDTEKMTSLHHDHVKDLHASHHDLKVLVAKIEAINSNSKEKIEKLEIELSKANHANCILQRENETLKASKANRDEILQLEEENRSLRAALEENIETVKNLNCDLSLTEESFQAERNCKNRLYREITRLECELKKAQEQRPTCNTQIIMPTTINVNSDNPQAGLAVAEQLQQNVIRSVGSTDDSNVFKRPALPSSRSGRESAASNNSSRSDLGSLWTPSHSIVNSTRASEYYTADEDRLSVLRERNKKQPMHLKSSYAAELQNLPNDENVVKALNKPATATVVPQDKMDQTFTVTETMTTTTTTREVKMPSSLAKDMIKKAKGISPGSRSVFRRAITAPKTWSPKQKKPTNEIPYS